MGYLDGFAVLECHDRKNGGAEDLPFRPDVIQKLYPDKLNPGLSNRTVQYLHSVLYKALDQALKWGFVS